MYPPKFDYYRASSTAEAIALAKEHDGKFLAGGHSLLPVMKLRLADPGTLVDIGRLSNMKGITTNGDTINIGALTTHTMVTVSDDVPSALSEAAGMIGDPQVRNRGTVGGNIAHADPASDLPTVLLALKASIHLEGSNGSRTISADDFFIDLFATALQEDEIITAVSVSSEGKKSGSAYAKLFNPASRYAMVGAAAQLSIENGVCSAASVTVGGLTPKATRASSVEAALIDKKLDDETLATAAAAIANDLGNDVMGDMHASADYRRQMAPIFVRRALEKAASRAR